MNNEKTEIILVVDQSGSMSSVKDDMEKGFASYLEKQKAVQGDVLITYYRFSSEVEKVFEGKPLSHLEGLIIDPSGMTAFLDAMGRAIDETGERYANMQESERPGNVLVVVITDGYENASRKFTTQAIKDKVKHQQDKYNWKFIFMGANMDAVSSAGAIGISANNSMTYAATASGLTNTFDSLSVATTCLRTTSADYSFTPEERKAAVS